MFKSLIAVFGLMLLGSSVSWAADSCVDTANLFRKAGQSATFFKHSYGYAVFPTIGKGGVGIGGAYGKGCVLPRANMSATRLWRSCRSGSSSAAKASAR